VYRRSLSSGLELKAEAFNCETRKDSAVHVSLSSSSLVKQPGSKDPTSIAGRFVNHPPDDKQQPTTIGC
jgi:hypothetical protein